MIFGSTLGRLIMFTSLFKSPAPLPEESIQWLFDGFGWSLRNFGSDVFFHNTPLIEPSNQYFPGQGDSVDEMARLIFKQVQGYCGLNYWPCHVIDHHRFEGSPEALPDLRQTLQLVHEGQPAALKLFYEPQQVANPNAMIANYVQALAHHLTALAQEPAPCEKEQWPHLLELIGVYMGFGIMFTNTAIPKRAGGCGSCHNPAQDRQGAMTEMEVLYAVAIFCVLKDIPQKQVSQHIKGYLKPLLKKAIKDVQGRTDEIARLKAIDSTSQVRGEQIRIETKPA